MVLQSVLFDNDNYDTYNYNDIFDAGTWYSLTGIKEFALKFEYKGNARIYIYTDVAGKREVFQEATLDSADSAFVSFKLSVVNGKEKFFFRISASEVFFVNDVRYEAVLDKEYQVSDCNPKGVNRQLNDVMLGLIICTYEGKDELKKNLLLLKDSFFFKRSSLNQYKEFYGKLKVVIVDNKDRLKKINTKYLTVVHNANQGGGTGGFTRGLKMFNNREVVDRVSHIIFMDDDVDLYPECLYRLYSILSLIKKEFKDRPVAGRMFDKYRPFVQYTAVEEWNKGYIRHISHDTDMSDLNSFKDINDIATGEYGGWWFCCYPYSFAEKNMPIPFFLHCDDVEYGLRCGKKPIILNGIHVHHETPEKKANPVLSYYDARNTMIVNAVHGISTSEEMIEQWKNRMATFKDKGDFDSISMTLLALLHFLNGADWFLKVNGKELHSRLMRRDISGLRYIRLILRTSYRLCWRSVYLYAKIRIKAAITSYRRKFSEEQKI